MKKCKYFTIQELVSPEIYKEFGDNAWSLIDDQMMDALDSTREHFTKKYGPSAKMIINNWHKSNPKFKPFRYRGLRPENCKEGAPQSQHKKRPLNAIDFDIIGLTDDQVKDEIMANEAKFYSMGWRRMESREFATGWTHLDRKKTRLKFILVFNP